jgi:hypothetical protein
VYPCLGEGGGGGATAAAGPPVFHWLAEQGGQQEARGGRGRDAPGRYASLVPSPRSGRRIRPQRDAFVTRVGGGDHWWPMKWAEACTKRALIH